jgi:hypothetical protein
VVKSAGGDAIPVKETRWHLEHSRGDFEESERKNDAEQRQHELKA